jgi:RecA/RadA recombinase
MSVEALTIAAVVEEGPSAIRKLYSAGITERDFPLYDEEFRWIERRLVSRKTLNRRVFRQRFPDFEWAVPKESIDDLAAELKEERAFEDVNTLVASLAEQLQPDNAVELAVAAREQLSIITRSHAPMSDVDMDDWQEVIQEMREGMRLAKMGIKQGIPTGFAHLDHHWGGFMPGQFIGVLGRTGEGKSYKTMAFAWSAKKHGYRVGLFTPEMSKHECRCRYHTLASADKDIQKALGLERSFRNRALMNRTGFHRKSFERFTQYLAEELPGRFHMLSGTNRPEQMSVGYIEDRIVELALDFVIVDPIYLLKPVRISNGGNEYQEIGWIAEALHVLGERYNIPIVFTNQAHMEGGAKDDAPHKDRSFGAKSMMHLADYIIGVKHISEDNRMIVRGTKSRFGQNFRYEVDLYANTGVIRERTPVFGNYMNGNDADEEDADLRAAVAAASGEED